jgi:hypothetical protein
MKIKLRKLRWRDRRARLTPWRPRLGVLGQRAVVAALLRLTAIAVPEAAHAKVVPCNVKDGLLIAADSEVSYSAGTGSGVSLKVQFSDNAASRLEFELSNNTDSLLGDVDALMSIPPHEWQAKCVTFVPNYDKLVIKLDAKPRINFASFTVGEFATVEGRLRFSIVQPSSVPFQIQRWGQIEFQNDALEGVLLKDNRSGTVWRVSKDISSPLEPLRAFRAAFRARARPFELPVGKRNLFVTTSSSSFGRLFGVAADQGQPVGLVWNNRTLAFEKQGTGYQLNANELSEEVRKVPAGQAVLEFRAEADADLFGDPTGRRVQTPLMTVDLGGIRLVERTSFGDGMAIAPLGDTKVQPLSNETVGGLFGLGRVAAPLLPYAGDNPTIWNREEVCTRAGWVAFAEGAERGDSTCLAGTRLHLVTCSGSGQRAIKRAVSYNALVNHTCDSDVSSIRLPTEASDWDSLVLLNQEAERCSNITMNPVRRLRYVQSRLAECLSPQSFALSLK